MKNSLKKEITIEEYEAIKKEATKNKNKNVDKRLKVLIYRYEGFSDKEIANKLDYSVGRISQLCSEFKKVGLEEYTRQKYKGNYRYLSEEEEKEILEKCNEKGDKGEFVNVKEIRHIFEVELGFEVGDTYTYNLLKRHGWRKVMPRPQHEKKASEEEIEASKKLTQKLAK